MKRPITAEDLYRLAWVGDAAPSPDAASIAYVSRTVNEDRSGYRSQIHVVRADGSADRTFTAGEQDSSPSWSPDGKRIAFIRKRGDRQQVWAVPADGGEAFALTPDDIEVGSFAWSPDGERLLLNGKPAGQSSKGTAAPAVRVVERLKWRADGEGIWTGSVTRLYVYAVDGREPVRAVTDPSFDVLTSVWSPDGKRIAFAARRLDGETDPDRTLTQELFAVDLEEGSLRKLTEASYAIHRLAFVPDGTRLAFIGHDRRFAGATHNALYVIPADGGEASLLSEGLDVHIGNAVVNDMRSALPTPLLVSRDGQSFYALASVQGDVQVYRFGAGGAYVPITQGEREVYHFAGQPDDGTLWIASADALSPGDLYRLDLQTRHETRLTRSNDALLDDVRLSAPEPFRTTAPDGGALHGWYMKPAGAEEDRGGKPYPVVLEIHGGPHAMYGSTFMLEFQLLAAQGFGVVYANPRGSHGYGQRFADACRRDYGGGDYMDVLAGVDYVIKHDPNADETRLGVTGGSYGGFLTNWIVGHTNRFRAAVTQRSISNWLSFYGTSDIGYFFAEEEIGGSPWRDTEAFWRQSPIAYAEAVKTPLLILHGENDLRCPIEQAEQLYAALKKLGKTTQFVRFPESSHELSRKGHPQLRIERLNRIAGWFKSYLS
ncbi:S9 family peptidase [Paenibacillus hodogayensis]|uniref:S9 family peptidase n=1 Tax=Paenibacillus hodogayensis TaxID=279208 RepID=A0ABV5W6W1_9BACL